MPGSPHRSPRVSPALVLLAMALLASAAPHAAGSTLPSPEDWRDVTIYQVLTDRFNDGNPSNNTLSPSSYSPTNSRRIHGGDFRGIEQKLDYIQALGAQAIWISPIPLNVGNSAYHGYGAHDFYTLSPHWGTMADLQSMVSNAHVRGIYVILDVVCNHTGDRIGSFDAGYSAYNTSGYQLSWWTSTRYPAPFDGFEHFHNLGDISAQWYDPPQILGELSGLDDLRTETAYVRTNLVNIYTHWITQGGFDGFRLDTVKHVDLGFWQYFNPAIRAAAATLGKSNFFQFGEVYDGSDAKCGLYTGTQAGGAYANDSVLDFPLYFQINDVFARATAPPVQIRNRYQALGAYYHPDARDRLVTFLDNHDVPRFMNSANANNHTGRLHVATAFLYTARGVPSLYYGTEQNFNGGSDPNNREDMFAGLFPSTGPSVGDRFDMTEPTFRHIARLHNFRRLYPALRRGTHHNLWHDPLLPGLFAYARRLGDEEVFVAMNTSGSTQVLPARPTIYPAGTRLVNLIDPAEVLTVTGPVDGIPPVAVPGSSFKIFIDASRWQPLDPVVERQVPRHDATAVPWHGGITLDFSQPMDPASVEASFSVLPALAGRFLWSAHRTRMTFVPDTPGFASNRRYAVRLGPGAASDETGLHLRGAFETIFVSQTVSGEPQLPADGLPHWWRAHTFGTTEASAALKTLAGDDFDGDSVSNLDEFTAWTGAADAQSFLALGGASASSGIVLRYPTVAERWYRVWFTERPVLTPQPWEILVPWHAGIGGIETVDDAPSAEVRFYRLEVSASPPPGE